MKWFPPIAATLADPGPDRRTWKASDWARWENHFYSVLRDFKFLPGGRIQAAEAGVAAGEPGVPVVCTSALVDSPEATTSRRLSAPSCWYDFILL